MSTAAEVVNTARLTLQDPAAVTWSDAELLDYLTKACRAVALIKPDATAKTATLALVAGVVQTLPSDASMFLEATHNVVGSTPGAAVRLIDRLRLTHTNRNWSAAVGASVTVIHVMHDKTNPTQFFCYPYNTGTGKLSVIYSAQVAAIAATGTTLPVLDVYTPALHLYVVALAYAKNTKRGDLAKFQQFLAAFFSMFGMRTPLQMAEAPVHGTENIQ